MTFAQAVIDHMAMRGKTEEDIPVYEDDYDDTTVVISDKLLQALRKQCKKGGSEPWVRKTANDPKGHR